MARKPKKICRDKSCPRMKIHFTSQHLKPEPESEDVKIARAVLSVKRAHKKLETTFDGPSNDAEHDAALVLSDALYGLYTALGMPTEVAA